jgi:acetyl esterase/lipase
VATVLLAGSCGGGAPALVSRVHLPAGTTPAGARVPLVVLVPGGGWTSADPAGLEPLAAALAVAGDVAVTTTYRTAGDAATFPTPLSDVVCAIDEAARRVAARGATPWPVVVVGHSAGAQLAALAALVGDRYHRGCPVEPVPVDGFVGLSGPYDVLAAADAAEPLFGAGPEQSPAAWRAGDPMAQVANRPALPVLLLHGLADGLVPADSSRAFAAALRRAGHPVRLVLLPGVDHLGTFAPARAAGPVEDFVRRLSAGSPPAAG